MYQPCDCIPCAARFPCRLCLSEWAVRGAPEGPGCFQVHALAAMSSESGQSTGFVPLSWYVNAYQHRFCRVPTLCGPFGLFSELSMCGKGLLGSCKGLLHAWKSPVEHSQRVRGGAVLGPLDILPHFEDLKGWTLTRLNVLFGRVSGIPGESMGATLHAHSRQGRYFVVLRVNT
jgi:hypothetical protein